MENIPVLEYPLRDEIEEYLGYRHITGVKAWGPLAKAKYLKKLQQSVSELPKDEQYKSLARTIGSKSNHVRLLLVGLEVTNKIQEREFYNVKNLDDTTINFGVLYTAIAKSNISEFVGVNLLADDPLANVNLENLGHLTKWMFERDSDGKTILGESRNLTELDEVLGSEIALEQFKTGLSLEDSVRLTIDPHASLQDYLESANTSLMRSIDIIDSVSEDITEEFKITKRIEVNLEKVNEKLKTKL